MRGEPDASESTGAMGGTGWLGLGRTLWKYSWTAPNTLIGLAIGLLLMGRFRWVDGVIEIHSQAIAIFLRRQWVPAAAMTLGHVVIGQDRSSLDRTRRHERIHVRQYERWGPCFLPAYVAFSVWAALRGRDPYRGNRFEIEAYANDGSGRA